MKKLIFMLLFSVSLTAQTFDFECGPFPAEIITFEILDDRFHPIPFAFIEINGRIPTDGLRARTAFLDDFKGVVISVIHSLSDETEFLIANIGLANLRKLETKFNNKEPIYLDIN